MTKHPIISIYIFYNLKCLFRYKKSKPVFRDVRHKLEFYKRETRNPSLPVFSDVSFLSSQPAPELLKPVAVPLNFKTLGQCNFKNGYVFKYF